MKDKNGDTPLDLVSPQDKEIAAMMRKARAQASVARDDIADGASSSFYCFLLCYLDSRYGGAV